MGKYSISDLRPLPVFYLSENSFVWSKPRCLVFSRAWKKVFDMIVWGWWNIYWFFACAFFDVLSFVFAKMLMSRVFICERIIRYSKNRESQIGSRFNILSLEHTLKRNISFYISFLRSVVVRLYLWVIILKLRYGYHGYDRWHMWGAKTYTNYHAVEVSSRMNRMQLFPKGIMCGLIWSMSEYEDCRSYMEFRGYNFLEGIHYFNGTS